MSPDELEDVYQALDEVESEIGIHLEQDILSWMTGELAFALLLPDGASLGFEELHANLYVSLMTGPTPYPKWKRLRPPSTWRR